MGNSHEENWANRRLIGGSPAPEPVSSPTPPEHSELTAERAFALGYISALPKEHYMKRGESMEDKQPGPVEDEPIVLTKEMLKRYTDQARAYGWEAGRYFALKGIQDLRPQYDSHADNPFVRPDWDAALPSTTGFQVTAKDNPL